MKFLSKDYDKEEVEEFLIKFAINNNIPLIAICRGMQKVVSYFNKDVISPKTILVLKEITK